MASRRLKCRSSRPWKGSDWGEHLTTLMSLRGWVSVSSVSSSMKLYLEGDQVELILDSGTWNPSGYSLNLRIFSSIISQIAFVFAKFGL